MDLQNVGDVLRKLDEVRALFAFGQRIMPVLEELFTFTAEIAPLLEEVNSSINDSLGKMPRVSTQLQNVTRATETATSEILDHIDLAMSGLDQMRSRVEQSQSDVERLIGLDERLEQLVGLTLSEAQAPAVDEITQVMKDRRAIYDELQSRMQAQITDANAVHDKMSGITISLQVQDITAQQIAAVDHLIESIQVRLDDLLSRLSGQAPAALEEVREARNLAFNADAEYDRSGRKQDLVEALLADNAKAAGDGGGSQESVDVLFSQASVASADVSQDDIDKLFGGPGER